MATKNTILTEKDSRLLEKTLVKYSRIVQISDLMEIFTKEYSVASAHNRISFLNKAGWLMRIKKGSYLIIDSITSRSFSDMSLIRISNSLQKESYVTLSAALNYYQMFDQYTKKITACSLKISKKYIFSGHIFKFSKISKKLYFGYKEKREAGQIICIADAEKALIDYLYLDKNIYSANLVYEKIVKHHKDINIDRLQEYAKQSEIVTLQRKIGFLLENANLNANKLYEVIKREKSCSRFTKNSKLFNSKWRIYYEDSIIRKA